MAVSFIGGGIRNTRRKLPTCRKSLTNLITQCCIEYTSPWAGFYLPTLVVIGTDCISSFQPNTMPSRPRRLLARAWNPIMFEISKKYLIFRYIWCLDWVKGTRVADWRKFCQCFWCRYAIKRVWCTVSFGLGIKLWCACFKLGCSFTRRKL